MAPTAPALSAPRVFDPLWLAKLPAFSVRQPWATSIVQLGKPVENRTWPDRYRDMELGKLRATDGWFRVHASKADPLDEIDAWRLTVESIPEAERNAWPILKISDLPRGGIIGVAHFSSWVTAHPSPWFRNPGAALLIDEVHPLPFTPCRGALGFFMPPS